MAEGQIQQQRAFPRKSLRAELSIDTGQQIKSAVMLADILDMRHEKN